MASDRFLNLMKMGVLITLFSFLMVTFVIKAGEDYGMDITEIQNDKFNLTGINQTLESIEQRQQTFQDQFEEQNFFSAIGYIVVTGIFGLVKDMFSFILTPITLFIKIIVGVIAPPSDSTVSNLIIAVVTFILVSLMIFGGWSLMKRGD